MSYRPQISFSAGELDPVLHERTNLEKFNSGLATGRNVVIGKSGRIISRGGTSFIKATKVTGQNSVIFSPPYNNYVLEFGIGYVRANLPDGSVAGGFQVYDQIVTDYTISDLSNLQFVPAGSILSPAGSIVSFVYVFCTGKVVKKFQIVQGGTAGVLLTQITNANVFLFPIPPTFSALDTSGGTGYSVEYAFTYMIDGLESDFLIVDDVTSSGTLLLPIMAGEVNAITIGVPYTGPDLDRVTELRVYRRPTQGQAFGFIGSAPTGGNATAQFVDVGGDADYTHSPPASIPIVFPLADHANPIATVTSKTGAISQQRLLVSDDAKKEAVYASRTGYLNSFFTESTLTSDSAVAFKSGSTGSASILYIFDSQYGRLFFTTVGVFQNNGALDYTNLGMNKVSTLVIQDNIPPLEVPGGLLVVDKSTNSIQAFSYSYTEQTFPPDELSIFSNHLIKGKKVVSWAFQDGDIPLVWIVLNDGSLISVTYKKEQLQRAWTRHDSDGAVFECVTVRKDLAENSIVYFQVNRAGVRGIESVGPRELTDLKSFVGMDAAVTFNANVGDFVDSGLVPPEVAGTVQAVLTCTALDVNNWEGNLRITSDRDIFNAKISSDPLYETGPETGFLFGQKIHLYYGIATLNGFTIDPNHPGTLRFFDSQGSAVDLQIVSFVNAREIIVTPSVEFPSDQGSGCQLYHCYGSTLTGLDHLNGKFVSVMVDGYVEGSPKNNIENYEEYYVENGQITLVNEKLGAFIHVGLPFVCDIETLEIDTVEQKPTELESKIVNKVYVKVFNTRGLYVGSKFAANDYIDSMSDPETLLEDPDTGIVGNKAQDPITKRYGIICRNDWAVNGKVCIRQVDPLPFEILSITPDLQVLT